MDAAFIEPFPELYQVNVFAGGDDVLDALYQRHAVQIQQDVAG